MGVARVGPQPSRAGPLRRGKGTRDLSPRVQKECDGKKLPSTSRHGGPRFRHQALSTLTSDFQPPEKELYLLYHIQRVLSQQLKQASQNLLSGGPAEAGGPCSRALAKVRSGERPGAPRHLARVGVQPQASPGVFLDRCLRQALPLRVVLTPGGFLRAWGQQDLSSLAGWCPTASAVLEAL